MPMPNLPVARVMWKAMPNLTTGVECWITAGGAHHTVLSYDVTAEQMRDFEHLAVEFVRRELANRHGLLVEPLEPLDDVLFDILDVSIDLHRIPHGVNRG